MARIIISWLVVLGFNATLTAKVISWWSVMHMCFPGFLTPVLTVFFPNPMTTFLKCFCRGERQKYTKTKVCLHWGSNSQPPGDESNALTTEPFRWDSLSVDWLRNFCLSDHLYHLQICSSSRITLHQPCDWTFYKNCLRHSPVVHATTSCGTDVTQFFAEVS